MATQQVKHYCWLKLDSKILENDKKVGMMMNETPKVSVIIPVYNAEPYLRKCLDSVVNQTLQDIEIICVDDGSTDNSLKILEEYKNLDSRLNIICQQNQYAGVARNNGMARAKGEYLIFLDADDFFELSMLDKMYMYAKENNLDVTLCNADRYDNKKEKFLPMSWLLNRSYLPVKKVFNAHDVANYIFQITIGVPWNKLFNRNFVEKLGIKFPNTPRSNDTYFTFSVLALATRISVINEVFVHYRVNTGTNLQASNEKTPTAFLTGLLGIKKQLIEHGLYEEFKRSYINKAMDTCMYVLCSLKKNKKAYNLLSDKLQSEFLYKLELLDKSDSYFYDSKYYGMFEKYLQEIGCIKAAIRPKVSVIIPVYNAEKYLRQCLDSVANQTLQDIEIICVDDGSTDESLNIIEEYIKKDNRFQVLHQHNQYAGVARNNGMVNAKGEYIIFLDADDFFEITMLEVLYNATETNNVDIVICGADRYNDKTNQFLPMPWILKKEYLPKKEIFNAHDIPNYIFQFTTGAPWNKLFRKEFLDKTNLRFQATQRANDIYFSFLNIVLADKIKIVAEVLVHYRINTGTNLQSGNNITPTAFITGLVGIKEQLIFYDIYDEFKRSFINRAMTTCMYTLSTLDINCSSYRIFVEQMKEDYLQKLDLLNKASTYFYDAKYYAMFSNLLNTIISEEMSKKIDGKPRFSIIVPIYNAEKYLRECLDSIVKQTINDFEVICVDDGSTDASGQILYEYASKDKRFRIIHQKNQYAGVARNNGIAQAIGKYIVFLDADDLLSIDALEKYHKAAFFSNADIVISGTYTFENDFTKAEKTENWLRTEYLPTTDVFSVDCIRPFIFNFTTGGPGGKCFKRSFVKKESLFFLPIPKSEDFYFIQMGLVKAKIIAVVREPVYYIRSVSDSLEHRKHEMPLMFWDAVVTMKQQLQKENLYYQVEQSFVNASVNRFAYNLRSTRLNDAYNVILRKLYSVYESELGLGLLPKKYYYRQDNYEYLCKLLKISSKKTSKNEKCSVNVDSIYDEAKLIRLSASYRIGRFITYIPRKLRGGIRCYKEHGLVYTLGRVKEKFIGLVGGSK